MTPNALGGYGIITCNSWGVQQESTLSPVPPVHPVQPLAPVIAEHATPVF